ncbi:MAG: hypothetical protein HY727_07235 [Candidatus Rokubacteria bacterium]|nr:hypothetical protein [Candidatus Rokubacteria bacterium]
MACTRESPCAGILVLDRDHLVAQLRSGWTNATPMYRCLGSGHTFLDDALVPVRRDKEVRRCPNHRLILPCLRCREKSRLRMRRIRGQLKRAS